MTEEKEAKEAGESYAAEHGLELLAMVQRGPGQWRFMFAEKKKA